MKNNDNCIENYGFKRAKKIIDDANKNVQYYCLVGPTGPRGEKGEQGIQGLKGEKGEDGASTIEIGMTETIEPEMQATVINTGTPENVVLNFKIPRGKQGEIGMKGDKGDQGPRGFPGEIGQSEVITIDGTETLEPNEKAEVQDDFEGRIHHLTFYIPKGEKGDQGPKGDSIGLGAYGERYSNKAQTFRVQADRETIIPLEETGQGFFINYNSSYAIEIKKLGTYQISYILNVTTSEDATYTVSVKTPLYKVPACETKVISKANQLNRISASAFFGLIEGDEVTLVIKSDKDTDLIFEDTINAKLTILKVD